MHSALILFFGYANKSVAPPGAIREFSAEGGVSRFDFYIRGDGRTKSEYKIKIWIHWKVGGNLFDSRGFESFRGEFLRRRCSIDFEINRMRDLYGGGKNISSSSERNIHVTEKNKKKFAMKFFVRFSSFIYLFLIFYYSKTILRYLFFVRASFIS